MPTISADTAIQTIISTYEVSPANCQDLLEHLAEMSRTTMVNQPGFVSASFHVNDARTRIANYAQWRSREDFQAMLRSAEMRPHIKRSAELCERFEPVLYDVAETVAAS